MSYIQETLTRDSMVDTMRMANRGDTKCKRYVNKNIDITTLGAYILKWFKDKHFTTHVLTHNDKIVIQGSKRGYLRAVTASNRCLTVLIEGDSNDFKITLTTGKWIENAASWGVGTILTGGASVGLVGIAFCWTFKLKVELHKFIEDTIKLIG